MSCWAADRCVAAPSFRGGRGGSRGARGGRGGSRAAQSAGAERPKKSEGDWGEWPTTKPDEEPVSTEGKPTEKQEDKKSEDAKPERSAYKPRKYDNDRPNRPASSKYPFKNRQAAPAEKSAAGGVITSTLPSGITIQRPATASSAPAPAGKPLWAQLFKEKPQEAKPEKPKAAPKPTPPVEKKSAFEKPVTPKIPSRAISPERIIERPASAHVLETEKIASPKRQATFEKFSDSKHEVPSAASVAIDKAVAQPSSISTPPGLKQQARPVSAAPTSAPRPVKQENAVVMPTSTAMSSMSMRFGSLAIGEEAAPGAISPPSATPEVPVQQAAPINTAAAPQPATPQKQPTTAAASVLPPLGPMPVQVFSCHFI